MGCGRRYDGIAPPSNLEALHTQIAGSQLEFFEGGHLFLLQDPAASARVVGLDVGVAVTAIAT